MNIYIACLIMGMRLLLPGQYGPRVEVNLVGWGDSNTAYFRWSTYVPHIYNKHFIKIDAGVPGNSVAEMIARFDSDVGPYLSSKDVCVIWGGLNDDSNGASVDTIYRRLQVACSLSQSTGAYTLISCYCMTGGNMYAVNDLLQANWASFADNIIDPTEDIYIGESADHDNTYWFTNSSHYSSNGCKRYAELYVTPAIRSLL